VMSIPILRGRSLAASDDERAPRVVVVSQRLAAVLWPGQDPVGRLIAWPRANGAPREPVRVVGIAADTRPMTNGGVPPLAMYLPFPQQPTNNLALVVRARGRVPVSAASMQRIVAGVNASVAVLGGRTLLDRLSAEAKPQQTASAWIGVFGAIALLLAAVGLYGVAAQTILQRRRELAIRAAVGATPVDIIALVLGDGMRLAMLGVLIGLVGSVAATQVLRASFAGIPRVDIWPGLAATFGLVVTTLIAVYVPARRGGRINPAEALRAD
jgi:hypothetical protein